MFSSVLALFVLLSHALTEPFFHVRVASSCSLHPLSFSTSFSVCGVVLYFHLPPVLCLMRCAPAPAAYLLLVESTSRVTFVSTILLRPRLVSWQRVPWSPHHLDTGPRPGPAASAPGSRAVVIPKRPWAAAHRCPPTPIPIATSSANRIPERFSPGTFDYFFASHQIFHCFVVAAALAHYASVLTAFGHWHNRLGECPAPLVYA